MAVFGVGEATAFDFSVSRNALVVLRLERPELPPQDLLTNFAAQGGVLYRIFGIAGQPLGERTLTLFAAADGVNSQVSCVYTVQAQPPVPGDIAVFLQTNRGCGDNAVFRTGELLAFSFSTPVDTLVVLRLEGPGGTQTLLNNFVARAGVIYQIVGTAGTVGDRKLIIDVASDGRTGHAECEFLVVAGVPDGDIAIHLRTNKGCGPEVVFRPGEGMFIEFRVSRTSLVRFELVGETGTQVLLNDFRAIAGFNYQIQTAFVQTGNFRARLRASDGAAVSEEECVFDSSRTSPQLSPGTAPRLPARVAGSLLPAGERRRWDHTCRRCRGRSTAARPSPRRRRAARCDSPASRGPCRCALLSRRWRGA
jgi:hypothetical protein